MSYRAVHLIWHAAQWNRFRDLKNSAFLVQANQLIAVRVLIVGAA
jgi:hypothetical protein